MASSIAQLIILLSFLISISFSLAKTSSKPKALILPVSKDANTLQYVTHFNMGTPLAKKRFVVDLGGRHLWMDCDDGSYVSSSFKQSLCGSAPCSVAKATCSSGCLPGIHRQGCSNVSCWVSTTNTITHVGDVGYVSLDKISIPFTDGSTSGKPVAISEFVFGCSNDGGLNYLAGGTNGMVGLGRESIALPNQLSSAFGGSFRRKFAICLPSTTKSNGVIFFGDSPYVFYPSYNTSKTIDVSSRLIQHTRLFINTLSGSDRKGPPSPEYFIRITSILVNKKPISINSSLLEINQQTGIGGTKISTVETYSKLERTIYKDLVKAFDEEIGVHNVSKVTPVAPFKDCYSTRGISMSPLGIGVPEITFVFENNQDVQWELFGANSMVEVSHDVACLAFLEDDVVPIMVTPIVIGTHQLQDHLLQFDLASNSLAFTNTLLLAAVECSNFNF